MNFMTLQLGGLATNCYIVPSGENRCILIDIGDGAAKLNEFLASRELIPEAILLTHGHYDHVLGVEEIRSLYQIPVYIHPADEICLRDGQVNRAALHTIKPFEPVKAHKTVRDGDVLRIGEREIRVLHTPGHTPGGVCYQIEDTLFTGDTLFAGSCGRIDIGGNAQDMRASLARLAALDGDFAVCPGHGESSTLDWERKHNPYMVNLR